MTLLTQPGLNKTMTLKVRRLIKAPRFTIKGPRFVNLIHAISTITCKYGAAIRVKKKHSKIFQTSKFTGIYSIPIEINQKHIE